MKKPPEKPEDPFQQAIAQWRQKHRLKEDEPLLLCLELFRIHQERWDAIRREEFPAFTEFREALQQLHQHAATLGRQTAALTDELRLYKSPRRLLVPSVTGLVLSAVLSLVTGILMGKFLL